MAEPVRIGGRPLAILLAVALAGLVLLVLVIRLHDPRETAPRLGMSQDPCGRFDNDNQLLRPLYDWAQLCAFEQDNARIVRSGERPRLVLIGDSLTFRWTDLDPTMVKRGIPGQTSAHLLLRFSSDVVALRPQVVHILVGTNDIAGSTGPSSPERVMANLASMVDLAQANGITVIVATVPPARGYSWSRDARPDPWTDLLNAQIRTFARDHGLVLADYHAVLVGRDGQFEPSLFADEAHPNAAGYARMQGELDAALARALDRVSAD